MSWIAIASKNYTYHNDILRIHLPKDKDPYIIKIVKIKFIIANQITNWLLFKKNEKQKDDP